MRRLNRGLAALVTMVATAAAAEVREVGFIEGFDGEPDAYRLERDSKDVDVRVFGVLVEGDRVAVREAPGRIRLQVGGSPVELTNPDETYVVEGTPIATPTQNVVAWLRDLVAGRSVGEPGDEGISLVSRGGGGGPLRAPLLPEGGVRLGAGTRVFDLAWAGGEAPYRVRLVQEDGTVVFDVAAAPDASLSVGRLALGPGPHRLEIRDAVGAALDTGLDVLADPPAVPAELTGDGALARTLAAAWRAQQGGGEWSLDAYQSVAGLPDDYAPARELRAALAEGRRP